MRNLILIIVCCFTFCSSHLFAQEWQWGRKVRFNAHNVAVDKYQNIYASWSLKGTYEIGGEEFTSYPSFGELPDAAFSSFDCDGNYRWTKVISGPRLETLMSFGQGIGVDTLGGLYVYFAVNKSNIENDSVYIATDTVLVSSAKINALLKYDTDGNYKWIKLLEDDSGEASIPATHMEVTPNGDCYLFCKLAPGTYGGGAFEVPEQDAGELSNDLYVLKYDKDGNFISGTHIDIYYKDAFFQTMRITQDFHSESFYMVGSKMNPDVEIVFGNDTIMSANYVAKFDYLGNVQWSVQSYDAGLFIYTGIIGQPAIDAEGNIYISGGLMNDMGFGDFFVSNIYGLATCAVFFKISPDGEVLYGSNASTTGASSIARVGIAGDKLAVASMYQKVTWGDITMEHFTGSSDIFFALFDINSLEQPLSIEVLESSNMSEERPELIISDQQGNFYLNGNFQGTLYVGDDVLYNQSGSTEGFIAKFGTDECYCPPPVAQFEYDSIPNQSDFIFTYTGTEELDSIMWNFGDGHVSYDTNPQHQFAQAGDYNVCVIAYNSCGSDTSCVYINAQNPVGIQALKEFENVKIYPNPVHDILYVTGTPLSTRIEIFNAVGQKVKSVYVRQNAEQISVASLPAGVYVLQLIHPHGQVGYQRVVRE